MDYSYRRKNGHSFKFGERRGLGHKCTTQVYIYVVKELLKAIDELSSEEHDSAFEEDSETIMAIRSSVYFYTAMQKKDYKTVCGILLVRGFRQCSQAYHTC